MDGGANRTWLTGRFAEQSLPPPIASQGDAETVDTALLRRLTRERLLVRGSGYPGQDRRDSPPALAAE